jgi:thioesterase domain-containing protein
MPESLRTAIAHHRAELLELFAAKSESSDCLIALREGLSAEPPLVCFHTLHGGAWDYRYLASYVHETLSVVGVQALGSWLGRKPLTTLYEVANYYAGQLMARWVSGPFRLFGASAGGLIALHTAVALCTQGREVAFLGVADTFDVAHYHNLSPHERSRVYWISFAEGYLPPPVMEIARADHHFWRVSDDHRAEILMSLAAATTSSGTITEELRARMTSDLRAFRAYCDLFFLADTPTFSGRLTYIRAQESNPEWSAQVRSSATLGTTEFVVPGNHLDVIRPPGVRRVADIITASLQQL